VPNTLIENQARNLLNNFARDLQQRGVDVERVEKEFIQMAYSQMRTQAERDVRGAMLLEKIAEAEKIAVRKDEVDEELVKMAEYYRVTPDEISESLEKQGGTATIENNLKTRKSIEALIEHAKVTDGPWMDESAETAEADTGEEQAEKKKKPAKARAKAAADKPAKNKSAKGKA
jgi:trigger factor